MYTLLYLKWIISKDLLYSTRNSAQCYVAPGWEGSLREKGYMCMYDWVPSLFIWNYHNIINWLCMFSCSVVSDSLRHHGLQPAMLLCPWVSQTRILEWIATFFSREYSRFRDSTCIYVHSLLSSGFVITEPPGKSNQLYPQTKKV